MQWKYDDDNLSSLIIAITHTKTAEFIKKKGKKQSQFQPLFSSYALVEKSMPSQ